MLTASEISTLIDECLQKERAALDLGNYGEVVWQEKIWFVLIHEMNLRKI